jgi:phosphoribosyl 1,2-cyclic phosphate phosphodiesterase
MKDKLQLLGTGGSIGVPMLGCKCMVCSSSNPNNKRLRSQAVIRIKEKNILIDVGPDIRFQCLKYGIERVDAIFISHYHDDHIGGLNDMMGFYFHRNRVPIPVYLSENTFQVIQSRFGYLLERFEFILINDHQGKFSLFGKEFHFFAYEQGSVPVLGFRYKNAAYITDIKTYDQKIFSFLEGVENLVLSALNGKGSHMHFSIEEAELFAKKAKIQSTYLIHLNHEVEYTDTMKQLQNGVSLATDGMELDV